MEEEVKNTVDNSVNNLEKISAFVINYLDELLTSMHLEVKMVAKFHKDQIIVNMDSNDNAILIGKDGRTLKALHMVVCKHTYQQLKIYPNVVLNVNNYQEQREENLIRLAKKVANDVKKTKNAVELDNMNSYERRIIHNALKDEKEISTISVGEEPNRHIVIKFIENQED